MCSLYVRILDGCSSCQCPSTQRCCTVPNTIYGAKAMDQSYSVAASHSDSTGCDILDEDGSCQFRSVHVDGAVATASLNNATMVVLGRFSTRGRRKNASELFGGGVRSLELAKNFSQPRLLVDSTIRSESIHYLLISTSNSSSVP